MPICEASRKVTPSIWPGWHAASAAADMQHERLQDDSTRRLTRSYYFPYSEAINLNNMRHNILHGYLGLGILHVVVIQKQKNTYFL